MTDIARRAAGLEESAFFNFARNVSTRYMGIAANVMIGLILLPINVQYLGKSAYGLWMLTASITTYFSVFELGYGSAVVKFVAEYRARRDTRGLNELLSTLFTVYTGLGVVVYVVAAVLAALLPYVFNLDPSQVGTGRTILLIIAANVTFHFTFAVYGGIVNGFQRHHLNNVIGTVAAIVGAVVNVLVLWAGYGLVELVAATTLVRMAPYYLYRRNAHAVFPDLRLRLGHVRRDLLGEATRFSGYLALIDWSTRLNYAFDTFTIGIFLNTAAIGVYSIGLRLSEALFRMTHQVQVFLLPAMVHRAVEDRIADQRHLLEIATRFQLAFALAVCGAVAALVDVLVPVWVGPGFEGGIVTARLLIYVVVLRAWMAVPKTLLKGCGRHVFVAKASGVTALANVLLSVLLVNSMGLVGVALGTVIPVTLMATFAIFPTACHEVQLSVAEGYRRIVWPAVWPALVTIVALISTRHLVPPRLLMVLAHMGAGVLAYAGLFFAFGLERGERMWVKDKVAEVWRRRAQVFAAA